MATKAMAKKLGALDDERPSPTTTGRCACYGDTVGCYSDKARLLAADKVSYGLPDPPPPAYTVPCALACLDEAVGELEHEIDYLAKRLDGILRQEPRGLNDGPTPEVPGAPSQFALQIHGFCARVRKANAMLANLTAGVDV